MAKSSLPLSLQSILTGKTLNRIDEMIRKPALRKIGSIKYGTTVSPSQGVNQEDIDPSLNYFCER